MFEMKGPCGHVAEVELELVCPTVSMEVANELIPILEIGELGEMEDMTVDAEWWKEKNCPSAPTAVTGGDKGAGLEKGGGIKLKALRVPREGEKKEDPRPESATRGPASASEVVEGGGAPDGEMPGEE